jgi:hypothetical protein
MALRVLRWCVVALLNRLALCGWLLCCIACCHVVNHVLPCACIRCPTEQGLLVVALLRLDVCVWLGLSHVLLCVLSPGAAFC